MSRRLVAVAGLLAALLAGVSFVLLVILTEGAGEPSETTTTDRGRAPHAGPDPDRTVTASPGPSHGDETEAVGPDAARRIEEQLAFHGIEGVVLLDGARTPARVELRRLRPGEVGYQDDEYPGIEISLIPREWAYPHWGYDTDAIPDLVRRRDPFAPPRAVAHAGADGRFRTERLPPGLWEVLALAADDRSVAVTVEVEPQEPTGFVELHLPAGRHVLTGAIRFTDGRPFTGAVRLVEDRTDTGDAHRATATCDARGNFRFAHVAPGSVWVLAWVPGVACIHSEAVRCPRPDPLEIVLDVPPRRVAGRVVDDGTGEPVASARVTVERGGRLVEHATVTATSGADGRFAIACEPDTESLAVRADGYMPRDVAVDGADTPDTTIRLRRLGVIEGRVTDPRGRPLFTVDVVASIFSTAREEFGTVARTVTDTEGRYQLVGLPPGEYTVMVWSPEWVSKGLADLTAVGFNPLAVGVTAGKTVTHDLAAEPMDRMRGRVVDDRDAPVPGARILVGRWEERGAFGRLDAPLVTIADARGHFAAFVPPGPFRCTAQADGYGETTCYPRMPRGESAPPRDPDGTVVLRLRRHSRPDRWMTIEVVDDRGQPVRGARVTWRGGPWWHAHASIYTGEDGRGRLGPMLVDSDGDLPGGVLVEAKGHLARICDTVRFGSVDDLRARVAIARTRTVTGRVLGPDGRPVAGARLQFKPIEPGPLVRNSWEYGNRSGTSGADGWFRGEAAIGPIRVLASARLAGRWQKVERDVTGDDPVVLKLPPPAAPKTEPPSPTLTVRVFGPRGRPVAAGEVDVYDDRSAKPIHWERLENGVCTPKADLWPRRRWYVVTGARDRDGRTLGARVVAATGVATGELAIRLGPEAAIEGVVVDADGRPAPGCNVEARYARTEPTAWWPQIQATARTDARGRFRLGGLGPLAYDVVVAAAPPAHPAGSPIRVTAPAHGVRVSLLRGREVKLRFLLENGRPVEDLTVHLEYPDRAAYPREGYTDATGLVVFHGLHPGRAHGLSTGSEARNLENLDRVSRYEWMPRDETFRMRFTRPITGVVRGADGRPVAEALVYCRFEHGWGYVEADEKGRFQVPGVPRAPTRLRAAPRGASWRDWDLAADSEVSVPRGTDTVDLYLPPYRRITVQAVPPPARAETTTFELHTQRADGKWTSRELESRGGVAHVAVSGADSGRHRLRVIQTGGSTTLAFEGTIDPAADTFLARLRPTVALRIRVTLRPASWLGLRPEVKVKRGPFTVVAKPVAGAEGDFQAACVVPGRCRVVVTIYNWNRIRARPGDEIAGWNAIDAEAAPGAIVNVPIQLRE